MAQAPVHSFQWVPPGGGETLVSGIVGKISSASTGGAYAVLELTLSPGGGAPLHTHHREDEIFHIVEGVCEVTVDGQAHRAEVGAVVVLPKHKPHAFRNPGDTPSRILITAVPGGLDEYFTALAQIRADDPTAQAQVQAINARYEIIF